MNSRQPTVSVLMTAYNREEFIGAAIESVLRSSYHDFELIVVDDGSTDKTVEIAQSFAELDTRVKLFVNEKNLGDYPNRNKAAQYAGGVYLKYLDSDDMLFSWSLQIMVESMILYPQAALGLSFNKLINTNYPFVASPLEAYQAFFYKNLLLSIGPSGSIIRRDLFESLGGFSPTQFVSDTELWLKLAKKNPVVVLPPNLVYWREHDQQQIRLEHNLPEIEARRFEMIKNILQDAEAPINQKEKKIILMNLTNVKCRGILKELLNGDFKGQIKRAKGLKLRLSDFLRASTQRNNYSHLGDSLAVFS